MKQLAGLKAYLDTHYHRFVFEAAEASGRPWTLHLHGLRGVEAKVDNLSRFEVALTEADGTVTQVPKHEVKFLYPAERSERVAPLLKVDEKVRRQGLEPILTPSLRHHIKNKSLFPLMMEKTVVFVTTLEGDVLRGLVDGFTRYEIRIKLKGGVSVNVLRHAVFDCRDKQGRSYLKALQEQARDWQKSALFVPVPEAVPIPET